MTRLSHAACTLVLAGTPLAACGARTGLVLPGETTDGGTPPSDGGSCTGSQVPLLVNAPNLYFVLDISGSMKEMNKWTNVRTVVSDLITQLGSRARFGATVFPAPGGDACAVGTEVLPLRLGDSQGATASAFMAATSLTPAGGTPTAPTFEALVPELTSQPEVTFAILATDGGPNCNSALSCNADTCTSNMDQVMGCPLGGTPNCCDPMGGVGGIGCLDGARATKAVGDLRAAGVETFVIGIPGSAPYAAVLDSLAQAGGTARGSEPYYYRVDTADEGALSGVLAQIAAKVIASCTFHLSMTPADPNQVNVYVAGALVPRDGPNGWSLQGATLTLEGSTCAAAQDGGAVSVASIRVVQGCPTVTH
jgi:hypothetical protein